MIDFKKLIEKFHNCDCNMPHECGIKEIVVESGAVKKTGEILLRNGFPKKLLLVADKNTLSASSGIEKSLKRSGYVVTKIIYQNLRVASMSDVKLIEKEIEVGIEGVIAVGTGSIHDPSRLACARGNVPLCLFATAPSMDGFASYSAPIVDNNFKITYPAKCPEVIIADTKILSAAPNELKSAGFGDMISKYIALIDWQVSHLITGESYCKNVAALTRSAVDGIMKIADKVTLCDEQAAAEIFESLILTGIAMSFTKTSRPGSGTEHIMAHYWECKELLQGKIPNYHGEDVGVATLIILDKYKEMATHSAVKAHKEVNDWADIYKAYGSLSGDVRKLNTQDTITDGIDPEIIENKWKDIIEIINSVPSYDDCVSAMKKAGCKTTCAEIGKSKEFAAEAIKYHPYMRRRLSLLRLKNMFEFLD